MEEPEINKAINAIHQTASEAVRGYRDMVKKDGPTSPTTVEALVVLAELEAIRIELRTLRTIALLNGLKMPDVRQLGESLN
jgi:hypothetical protein